MFEPELIQNARGGGLRGLPGGFAESAKRVLWVLLVALTAPGAAGCGTDVAVAGSDAGRDHDASTCSGPGQVACGGACVDTQTDPANCGACGTACSAGASCVAGSCECDSGKAKCGDTCVDLQSDAMNCGACGVGCAIEEDCVQGACLTAVSAWRTLAYGSRRSGYNPVETRKAPAKLRWSLATEAPVTAVVIDGGGVFVPLSNVEKLEGPSSLRVFGVADGKELWSHDFGNVISVGQATVAAGKVYVQSCNGTKDTKLFRLDAATGAVEWEAPEASQGATFWAPLVVGGAAFANGGEFGGLYGFARDTGALLFFNDQVEQFDEWSPASDGTSLISYVGGHLRGHDLATGEIEWTIDVAWTPSNGAMATEPAIGEALTYVVQEPSLYAVDRGSKTIAWSEAGSYDTGAYQGMLAVAGGAVYALSSGTLAVLDAATGAPLWTFAGDGHLAYPPVIAAGYVYVASDEHVYAVDIGSHEEAWSDVGGGWMAIAAGKLFVGRREGSGGSLSAYDLSP